MGKMRLFHMFGTGRASMSTTPIASVRPQKRFDVQQIQKAYAEKTPLAVITAYDHPTASAMNDAADIILVGDSVVSRGATRPFLVGDLPFGSYQTQYDTVRAAVRLVQEGGMHAVKLEGGRTQRAKISALVDEGIPVMGHVGLLPQTATLVSGSYAVQGRQVSAAMKLVEDALAVADAGALALVLEMMPAQLSTFITTLLSIPTIGIGSGGGTSGQVLVAHDLLGMHPERTTPFFAKQYASMGHTMQEAFAAYCADVRGRRFPGPTPPTVVQTGTGRDTGTLFTHEQTSAGLEEEAASSASHLAAAALRSYLRSAATARFHRDFSFSEFSAFSDAARRQYGGFPAAMRVLEEEGQKLQAAAAKSAATSAAASYLTFSPSRGAHPHSHAHRPLFAGLEPSLSLAVVGTGAVGSLLASQLAGNPMLSCVHVYGRWRARVNAINSFGLAWRGLGSDRVERVGGSGARDAPFGEDQGPLGSTRMPSVRAFCLDDWPAYTALLQYMRLTDLVPASRGGAVGVSSIADFSLGARRYDVVLLCGKAMDAPEQVLAGSLLVRSLHDTEHSGGITGSIGSDSAAPASVRGKPGVIIPMYNGAYTAEYTIGILGKLREASMSEVSAASAADASLGSLSGLSLPHDTMGSGSGGDSVAEAQLNTHQGQASVDRSMGAPPTLSVVAGRAVAAHLRSLRPLGQVGYGVTSVGAALGPGPEGSVACTGNGLTSVCVGPLYRLPKGASGEERDGALVLPPEHALRHTSTVSDAMCGMEPGSPLRMRLVPAHAWNAHRWAKLAVNAVLNPSVALLGIPNGGFVPRAHAARALMKDISTLPLPRIGIAAMAEEAYKAAVLRAGVAAPLGAEGTASPAAAVSAGSTESTGPSTDAAHPPLQRVLPLPEWAGVTSGAGLLELTERAAAATADNVNSMWADGLAGRPCEIDFISGAVVDAVEEGGQIAPAQRAAVAALHAREVCLGVRGHSGEHASGLDAVEARVASIVRIAKQAAAELKR